ncbi:hypothetical protein EP342_01690 [bacterium]|nr:MAG: hypothetical protein EP342_01690 [bacterium]
MNEEDQAGGMKIEMIFIGTAGGGGGSYGQTSALVNDGDFTGANNGVVLNFGKSTLQRFTNSTGYKLSDINFVAISNVSEDRIGGLADLILLKLKESGTKLTVVMTADLQADLWSYLQTYGLDPAMPASNYYDVIIIPAATPTQINNMYFKFINTSGAPFINYAISINDKILYSGDTELVPTFFNEPYNFKRIFYDCKFNAYPPPNHCSYTSLMTLTSANRDKIYLMDYEDITVIPPISSFKGKALPGVKYSVDLI